MSPVTRCIPSEAQQSFPVKAQTANTLDFMDHTTYVPVTLTLHCSSKRSHVNRNEQAHQPAVQGLSQLPRLQFSYQQCALGIQDELL